MHKNSFKTKEETSRNTYGKNTLPNKHTTKICKIKDMTSVQNSMTRFYDNTPDITTYLYFIKDYWPLVIESQILKKIIKKNVSHLNFISVYQNKESSPYEELFTLLDMNQ